MLVYGDPAFPISFGTFLKHFRTLAARINPESLDDTRALLIQAGQLEQAVADHWAARSQGEHPMHIGCAHLTEVAARLFYHCWSYGPSGAPAGLAKDLTSLLEEIDGDEHPELLVKIPEGFQFYTLFPEQYCAAAIKWAGDHSAAEGKAVLVVGIRSIGTSLSALVSTALRAHGWQTHRLTVRPWGHPFCREVHIPSGATFHAQFGIVVDEGPGMSGSSMAAVARALASGGLPRVYFFPGHPGFPGAAASAEVRQCWQQIPRYVADLPRISWSGRNLQQVLIRQSADLFACSPESIQCHDLSAGAWRAFAFPDESLWPAACPAFERSKYLCSFNRRGLLWKFEGLGCFERREPQAGASPHELNTRSPYGVATLRPLKSTLGFCASEWVEGVRPDRSEASTRNTLSSVSRHVVAMATRPDNHAHRSAVERLAKMLQFNIRQVLGDSSAAQTTPWIELALNSKPGPLYGDGRMAPWEWIRTRQGHLVKTDAGGHTSDHTLVGNQSLLWDVAGTLVEWDLSAVQYDAFVSELKTLGYECDTALLRFYTLAYAAFRLGMLTVASQQTNKPPELTRIRRDLGLYTERISSGLGCPPVRSNTSKR